MANLNDVVASSGDLDERQIVVAQQIAAKHSIDERVLKLATMVIRGWASVHSIEEQKIRNQVRDLVLISHSKVKGKI